MVVRKRWFKTISLHYFATLITIILMNFDIINNVMAGLLCVGYTIIISWKVFKEDMLFTPITPSLLFDISFGLYVICLVNTYELLQFNTMIVIATCMYMWKIISIKSNIWDGKKIYKIKFVKMSEYSFKCIVTILAVIAVAAMLFEWKMAGGIPILRDDQETFRFTVSYSAITHILAIMNKILVVIIGVYFINKEKIDLKRDYLLIIELVVAELMMVGTAMRGEMIMGPCILFIIYAIKKKVPLKFYLIVGAIGLLVIGVLPLYRMYNMYGISHFESLKGISKYPDYFFFVPLYQSFTNNFSILNLDISIFPDMKEFGLGIYAILPKIPFVELGDELWRVQNEVLNNNFYAGLTATYMASWYADFGYVGCMGITIIYAKLTNFAYCNYRRKKTLFALVWYAYTFYTALWMFYSDDFSFVYLCYSIVFWFAFRFIIKEE